MNFDKGITDVPLSICSQITNFVYVLQSSAKNVNTDDVNNHLNKTKSYVLNGINLLLLLEVLESNDGYLFIPKELFKEFHNDESKINSAIIQKIIALKPFIQY